MRIEQSHLAHAKTILHAIQALLTFIAGCLALAVLTKNGSTSPSIGFYFALCFLTIPALVYQMLVPMWTRAWRFANLYAYLAVDTLFTLLWFSAFIAVAVWQTHGTSSSSKDDDDKDSNKGNCSTFAFGSAAKCKTSEATIAFGVVLFLLWLCTTVLSILALRRGDQNPPRKLSMQQQQQTDKEDIWNPHLRSASRPSTSDSDEARRYGQTTDQQGLLPSEHDASPDPHPGRQLSFGSATSRIRPANYDEEAAPSALSPTGYHVQEAVINPFANPTPYTGYEGAGDGGRVQFPSGPY